MEGTRKHNSSPAHMRALAERGVGDASKPTRIVLNRVPRLIYRPQLRDCLAELSAAAEEYEIIAKRLVDMLEVKLSKKETVDRLEVMRPLENKFREFKKLAKTVEYLATGEATAMQKGGAVIEDTKAYYYALNMPYRPRNECLAVTRKYATVG